MRKCVFTTTSTTLPKTTGFERSLTKTANTGASIVSNTTTWKLANESHWLYILIDASRLARRSWRWLSHWLGLMQRCQNRTAIHSILAQYSRSEHPVDAFIMLGLNDFLEGATVSRIWQSFTKLTTLIRENAPDHWTGPSTAALEELCLCPRSYAGSQPQS